MVIYLGNLTVKQIEERLGIVLTDEERQFLISTKQEKAEKIAKDKWHCFDIPFVMVCGSKGFAAKIYEILKPYSDKMIDQIRITWNGEVEESKN